MMKTLRVIVVQQEHVAQVLVGVPNHLLVSNFNSLSDLLQLFDLIEVQAVVDHFFVNGLIIFLILREVIKWLILL